jgi:hypothetical protein
MSDLKPGTIAVDFNGFNIKSTPYHCWPPRGDNLIILINKAFELIGVETRKQMKPFKVVFDINDWGEGKYSIASDRYSEKAIPCFSFIHWKQGNIDDYTNVCEQISHSGKKPYKFEKIFWIGFLSHPTRRMFLQKYNNNPKVAALECNIMWGAMHQDNPIHNRPEIMQTNYVSLPDHCKYKYLLDMQGGGYSARTKFLMHSKRPIFYQNRKLHEYWFWDLKPFVHYIPVDENFLDFDQKLNWAESHPKECNQIAENAYEYARTKLRRQDAILRIKNILFKLGTGEFK